MTVVDKTAPSQTEKLHFELDLSHPPEKVWRALTDPELLAEWLLPAIGFKLERGAPFSFKTQAYPGWDGTVSCRMLEIEAQRKLSYTWTVPFLDTVMTFTLAPTTSGTLLSVEQTGFREEQQKEFGGARYGLKLMTGKLDALLNKSA
jgi:uncharacterized protein YndB with AHSA1/START domain